MRALFEVEQPICSAVDSAHEQALSAFYRQTNRRVGSAAAL
jgi:hypothetical protein